MRYLAWHCLFGLGCWLGTHGPTRRNGERITLPLARRIIVLAHPLWSERFSPDW